MSRKTTQKPEPIKKPLHTPTHTFKLVSFHEDSKTRTVNPKMPTYVVGVTWFRCRAYLGGVLGVDSSTVLLEAVKDLTAAEKHSKLNAIIEVPDSDLD